MSKPTQVFSSFSLLSIFSVGLFCYVTESIVPVLALGGLSSVLLLANQLTKK